MPLVVGRDETVAVFASEPCEGLFYYVLKAFAGIAAHQKLSEVTVYYRSRKIRDGVIAPIDLV